VVVVVVAVWLDAPALLPLGAVLATIVLTFIEVNGRYDPEVLRHIRKM